MWPLDDNAFYMSMITDSDRTFENWTLVNCFENNLGIPDDPSPFPESRVYSTITKNDGTAGVMTATSPATVTASEVDAGAGDFTVNMFLYLNPVFLVGIRVGIKWEDIGGTTNELYGPQLPPTESRGWVNINETFDLPDTYPNGIHIILEVEWLDSTGGDEASRSVTMTGFSVGQNSITSQYSNLGSVAVDLPAELGYPGAKGIIADQFGTPTDYGYYVVRQNRLLAHNDGMPIIFGTDNATIIEPDAFPSLLFPGKGMLHNNGRGKEYTFEMWMKIAPQTYSDKKIVGPLDSTDGVYVKEGFLILAAGNNVRGHYVGRWYRPMLIQVVIKTSTISLILNGEEVINMPFDKKTIPLTSGRDWWGIWNYDEFDYFGVDCVSFFPYPVAEDVAKRRYAYGQATESILTLNAAYNGYSTTIDFKSAEHGPSVIWPDTQNWDSGSFDNLIVTNDFVTTPLFALPQMELGGYDLQAWYEINKTINDTSDLYFSMKPSYEETLRSLTPFAIADDGLSQGPAYLNFDGVRAQSESVRMVWGVFQIEADLPERRTLFDFYDATTLQNFNIYVQGLNLVYEYKGETLFSVPIAIGEKFAAGIDLQHMRNGEYGEELRNFFRSLANLRLFVGGNGFNTFEGRIYKVSFSNFREGARLAQYFYSSGEDGAGFCQYPAVGLFLREISTYSLMPNIEAGQFYLDVSVSGYWEEYIPLSYFASYVEHSDGTQSYELDMLQLNVTTVAVEDSGNWSYQELKNEYDDLGKVYQDLSTDFETYLELRQVPSDVRSPSSISMFATFQKIADGANKPLDDFGSFIPINKEKIIFCNEVNTVSPSQVYNTAFEIVDNTIMYPPDQNFDEYAIVLHMSVVHRDVNTHPLRIKNMEISAKNFNDQDAENKTYIGTKYGTKIYPQIDDEHTANAHNPFFIFKSTAPYLYNSDTVGFRVGEITDLGADAHAYYFNINENASINFEVGSLQFMIKPDIVAAEWTEIQLFEIQSNSGTILYSLKHGDKYFEMASYDKAADGSLTPRIGDSYYQNGRYVSKVVFTNDHWNTIGIVFANFLDFSNTSGKFIMYGGANFDNISYYLSSGLGQYSNIDARLWQDVLEVDSNVVQWSYWADGTWALVYILGQSYGYLSTPSNIFAAWTGTNGEIVDDNRGIALTNNRVKVLTDVVWSTSSHSPV